MPGFASILNTGPNVPNEVAIQVYFTTGFDTVGMALYDKTTDSNNSEIVQSSEADPTGNLIFSSQLASTMLMSFNAVFGFTKQLDPKSPKIDVSIVCPVYQTVAATEGTNTTIASCSSPENTWVYYLRLFLLSGADQDSLRIIQSQVGKEITSITLEANDVRVGSSLAAYFDVEEHVPFVIYQHEVDGNDDVRQLYEYSMGSQSCKEPKPRPRVKNFCLRLTHSLAIRIQNTDDAAKLTSVAAVHFHRMTYLYYMANDNELRVITKVKGKWGTSSAVSGANMVNDSSQITAVSSGEANHVFYTDKSGSPVHLMLPY
ncbi:hypothetical protein MAC_08204 [Metarhizium acridum CQMa 102]|uniref:Fucose-specific lectin n=1 Tax=Metarhizium acridum (strain CQMa 102) TaxID=655827 RepID=E9EEA6_METAQ|nr:uncharacterized protein MAC_08204 [Metarhizium acridum CQMa 102]EFY85734.1 hypothetical protein MAC_08204 [Metarhizium acridum CQMa 102]